MVVFSHKFSITSSGETTDPIKKVGGGVQKWYGTTLSPMPSMTEIMGRAPAVDVKVDAFVCHALE